MKALWTWRRSDKASLTIRCLVANQPKLDLYFTLPATGTLRESACTDEARRIVALLKDTLPHELLTALGEALRGEKE